MSLIKYDTINNCFEAALKRAGQARYFEFFFGIEFLFTAGNTALVNNVRR